MSPADPRRLDHVFSRAARLEEAAAYVLAATEVRRARRILDARREGLAAEPCPRPVRRRIEGWFAAPRPGSVSRWLRAVFDSRCAPLPAARGARGATRTLRYVGRGSTVDLQIQTSHARGTVLHVAVNPPCPGATVEVRVPHRGPPRRAILDGDGTVDLPLPADIGALSVTLRFVSSQTVRVPTLRLP